MMKIKENFELRQVAGSFVVLSVADAAVDFNGMLTLNESGVLLWHLLEQGKTQEELVDMLLTVYEVSRQEASADVEEFLNKLIQAGCVDAQ